MNRLSVWFEGKRDISIREEALRSPYPGEAIVKTLVTAISPGTEMVVYRGEAPKNMSADETIPSLKGSFIFPLKYGYSAVGEVIHVGPGVDHGWVGKKVFVFHPHESHFIEKIEDLHPLPARIGTEEAIFLPNTETALTLALDGAPLAGEQVVVFGQGIVGLLLTAILSRFPLLCLATLDKYPLRRDFSEMVGARLSLDPNDPETMYRLSSVLTGSGLHGGADLTFEVSGNPHALNQAIEATGYSGRVILGSWYGTRMSELSLGGDFHRKRISLVTSQVSTINPRLRGRFTKTRMLNLAWEMIAMLKPSRFITHRFPISRAAEAYKLLDESPGGTIQVLITYGED